MPIFEADELAEIRADVREIMEDVAPDRCDISRQPQTRTRSATSPDQYTRAAQVIVTDVPCSYKISNSQERFLAGKSGDLNLWTVVIPADTGVIEDDFLTIQAKGDDPEKALIVATILRTSNALKFKVLCSDK